MDIETIERNYPSLVRAWNSPLRWTLTGSKNLRRIVDTPNHLFVVVEQLDQARALYRSVLNGGWITVAECESIDQAKAALLPCAFEAEVRWH